MNDCATQEQVDAWIEVLDRAEPVQPGIGWPLLIGSLGLVAVYLLHVVVAGSIGLPAAMLSAIFLIWRAVAGARFPVLDAEDRVVNLLCYYGSTVENEETTL